MSLIDKLKEYYLSNNIRMHMPGHKGIDPMGDDGIDLGAVYGMDITEIPGFDDLHCAKSEILNIEKRLASYYGVESAKILVNGSTAGIIAGILSLTKEGDKVLLSRYSHKSVFNAIVLGKLNPVFLDTKTDKYGIPLPLDVAEIEDVLRNNKDIELGVFTNPSYEGVFNDIKDIYSLFSSMSIPVLTDGAHGAHLRSDCHPDIEIKSLHKTLPFFTQTSCMLINSGRKELKEKISFYLSCFQSSSPSYILMGGIDRGLGFMEKRGKEAFDKLNENLEWFYEKVSKLKNFEVVSQKKRDPIKIIITSKLGPESVERLYNTFIDKNIIPEMQGISYILLMASIMNTRSDFEKIAEVLYEEDKNAEREFSIADLPSGKDADFIIPRGRFEIPMYKAMGFGDNKRELNIGDIADRFIEMYPPGIPIICPGEVITKDHIALVKKAKELNINVRGISGFRGL